MSSDLPFAKNLNCLLQLSGYLDLLFCSSMAHKKLFNYFVKTQQNVQFGLLVPQPKEVDKESHPLLFVVEDTRMYFDPATISGKSVVLIRQQAANKLWVFDKKNLMMVPNANPRCRAPAFFCEKRIVGKRSIKNKETELF